MPFAEAPSSSAASQSEHFLTGPRAAVFLTSLVLVGAFSQIDRILPFILAESIKAELRLSDTQLGLIIGIAFALFYALLSLPLARLADQGSPRAVLVVCTLLWSAMTALGGLAGSFATLALSRLGVALGEAGAVPSAHALIARRIAPERRGAAIGIFAMGIPVGAMVGFAAGGAIADSLGWRTAMLGAGTAGVAVALFALWASGPTPPHRVDTTTKPSFLTANRDLLALPAFRALFAAAVLTGFAAAPFYAFAAPFLIRTHGFTATEAGAVFGGLQGLTGIAGTLLGGRGFDRAVQSGGSLLDRPALLLAVAGVAALAALFVPNGWLSIALMVPAMIAFTFILPYAFGSAHRVAGAGREGMASGLILMATGLAGPALGPLIVGAVSDAATAAGLANGLGLGLTIVPVAALASAFACRVASRRMSDAAA
jgi:predicted MFS family arabinose efflux permease